MRINLTGPKRPAAFGFLLPAGNGDDCTEAVPLLNLLPNLKDCDILADKAYGTKGPNLSVGTVRSLYDRAESEHNAAVTV